MFPPWQVISRLVSEEPTDPLPIGYRTSTNILNWPGNVDYPQRQHYFEDAGISIRFAADPHDFELMIRHGAIVTPHIWVFLQTSIADETEIAEIRATMDELDYDLCGTRDVGVDTLIMEYSWNLANCMRLDPKSEFQSDTFGYRFIRAEVDTGTATLFLADSWSTNVDIPLQDYMMSYQLISPDWNNVAQLDLPLVHEGVPRRFSIDVSDVEPGDYRLVAILYDKETGERIDWFENDGPSPDLLTLAEVVLH